MGEWLSSGLAIDIILTAVALECVLLAWLSRHRRNRFAIWLPNLAAGAALLVALRMVIVGAAWSWVAIALGLALVAHIVDMKRRFEPQV